MQSFLLGTLALLIKVVPVCLRQHFGDKEDCGVYLFLRRFMREINLCIVVQVSHPKI